MLRDKMAEYEDEKQIEHEDILFCDFIDRWLEYIKQKVRGNTYQAYSTAAKVHVIPYFKKLNVTLGELLPIHIEQYYMDKLTDGQSRSSIVKHNSVIQTVYIDKVKNRCSKRELPLNPGIESYLKRLYAHQKQMKKLCGNSYHDNDYICKWEDGRPFEPNNVTRQFRLFLERNDLPAIRLHDLRHSVASLLQTYGFSPKEIAEWLGHGDVRSTNIYTHVEDTAKDKMADRLGEIIQI